MRNLSSDFDELMLNFHTKWICLQRSSASIEPQFEFAGIAGYEEYEREIDWR